LAPWVITVDRFAVCPPAWVFTQLTKGHDQVLRRSMEKAQVVQTDGALLIARRFDD
jgi:hypothetical protein